MEDLFREYDAWLKGFNLLATYEDCVAIRRKIVAAWRSNGEPEFVCARIGYEGAPVLFRFYLGVNGVDFMSIRGVPDVAQWVDPETRTSHVSAVEAA